jgi:polyisoprenoid-binding protein YceI
LFAGLAAVALVALLGGGAYIYFFSGLRTSPPPLSLATPTATTSPTASLTGLSGTWKVSSGSLAGYRVKELFVGQSSKHDAVAQTSTLSGGFTVTGDSSGYQITTITFVAGLTDLHSVDQVAGRDVSLRDGVTQRIFQQFPTATFAATSASVPGTVTTQQVDVSLPGKLTIRGVTKDVTVIGKAQVTGDKIEIAGSVSTDMSAFGISPPQVPFTTVDSTVVIEFAIFLTRTA